MRTPVLYCSADDLPEIKEKCSKLAQHPFDDCEIDVAQKIDACRYDLCVTEKSEWDEIVCDYLDDREKICKANGFKVKEWRNGAKNCK